MPNAYPLVLSLGALASLLWLGLANSTQAGTHRSSTNTSSTVAQIDAGCSALAGGLIGARMGFVLAHWSYYAAKPTEALWFWQGGLSWVGGVVGALIGLGLFAAIALRPFWPLADAMALPGAIMALSAWVGCLLDGCAYGRQVEPGLLTPPLRDMFAGFASRWPTQAAGALYSLAVLTALFWLLGRDLRLGTRACLSLSLIAAGALILSFARSDPAILIAGVRIDTGGSALVLALALLGLALRSRGD